ncbi:BglG family transcription antiterminator [Gracilibacillus suaedae]|uniref:BglG family transcription antiterminator n=1 Tax=Gracilibacillus suaedae TaxID=2820273 RepID=UPI001ABDCE6B|nr:BglG family transcription antiterminator [Gracilibacillus suaedae]
MNKRIQQLLKQFIGREDPVTSDQLATILQVSSRTVRNDIKILENVLQKNGAHILAERGQGYQLQIKDNSLFKSYIESLLFEKGRVPVEPEDRIKFLVEKFLLQSDYIKIEDLVEELFVSRSTLQKDLKDVKVILDKYKLTLEKRPNYGLKVSGDEKKIRYAISEELFKRDQMMPTDQSSKMLLPKEQMDRIQQIVLKHLRKNQLNLSDIALSNLVVHIAIACRRIEQNQYITSQSINYQDILNTKEHKIAAELLNEAEQALQITFPDAEIHYVTLHLLGTKIFLTDQKNSSLHDFEDPMLETARSLINKVDEQLGLGIKEDKELLAGIVVHLKPAIHRYRNGMNIRNPVLEAIKENYPVAFEAGVIAGKVIEQKQNIKIDENEIGYIALHFGAAIERTKLEKKPKRCLIVCTTGVGSSQLLLYKLRTKFANKISILGTTELHNLEQYESNVDLIISTVPLPDDLDIPYVIVSTILGEQDINLIEKQLDNRCEDIVDKYLNPAHIFLNQNFHSSEEVIRFVGRKLTEEGLVNDTFSESVLEREKAASTSYGNLVAIPHPLVPQSNRTFWVFCVLQNPIQWGENLVQLVCFLHVSEENKEELKPMYQHLISLVDNKDIVQKIIYSKSPEELYQILKAIS